MADSVASTVPIGCAYDLTPPGRPARPSSRRPDPDPLAVPTPAPLAVVEHAQGDALARLLRGSVVARVQGDDALLAVLPVPQRAPHAPPPGLLRLSDLGGDRLLREFTMQVLGDLQAVPWRVDDDQRAGRNVVGVDHAA